MFFHKKNSRESSLTVSDPEKFVVLEHKRNTWHARCPNLIVHTVFHLVFHKLHTCLQ